jgi:hypothetical protein
MAVGPGNQDIVRDTLESIFQFRPSDCVLILVDDCTNDGTYDLLLGLKDPRVIVLRNQKPWKYRGLLHTVAAGLAEAARMPDLELVLKTDTDALLTGHGLFDDAKAFARQKPQVGIFGRHLTNYDGSTKSYSVHTDFLNRELRFPRRFIPGRLGYAEICRRALASGWSLGENVFGGAYFMTGNCLREIQSLGYLDTSHSPRTSIAEDVYFTMCAVAAGFGRAQFAAPFGPLALAYDGLPAPARELAEKGMKLVHTVDKGKNTSRAENEGQTPREFFAQLRQGLPML